MRTILRALAILIPAVVAVSALSAREDHRAYRELTFPECAECHQGSGVAPNHLGGWLAEHRIAAARPDRYCGDCHDQAWCQDCHQGGGMEPRFQSSAWKRDVMPESHRNDWISLHPVEALSTPQTCGRCHEPAFCANCHTRLSAPSLTIRDHAPNGGTQAYIAAFPEQHAAEARRNLASCQSCHPDGDVCLSCHSARTGLRINPHPRDFQASRIKDRSNNRSCRVCHDF